LAFMVSIPLSAGMFACFGRYTAQLIYRLY